MPCSEDWLNSSSGEAMNRWLCAFCESCAHVSARLKSENNSDMPHPHRQLLHRRLWAARCRPERPRTNYWISNGGMKGSCTMGLRSGMTCVRLDARLHRWSYILRMLYRGTPSIPGCVTCLFLRGSLQRRTSCRLLFDQPHLHSSLAVYFDVDRPTAVSVHPTLSHSTEEQLALTSTGRITSQEIESQINSQKPGFGPGTPELQNHLISKLQM